MEIAINTYYSNRAYYPFIPRHVFDALEAAYLDGRETIVISEADYSAIIDNAKAAGLCPA